MDPILIDECLSPKLASVAHDRGLDAYRVAWVGLEGARDWSLAVVAAERDYIFVPNNRRDFLQHWAKEIG